MHEQAAQVMVFFSSCAAVKYHAELLSYNLILNLNINRNLT